MQPDTRVSIPWLIGCPVDQVQLLLRICISPPIDRQECCSSCLPSGPTLAVELFGSENIVRGMEASFGQTILRLPIVDSSHYLINRRIQLLVFVEDFGYDLPLSLRFEHGVKVCVVKSPGIVLHVNFDTRSRGCNGNDIDSSLDVWCRPILLYVRF